MAHAFALASAEDIAPRDLAPAAVGMSGLLAEMIPRRADQPAAGRFPGERPTMASAATTLAHLIDSSAAHGLDVGALTSAKRAADRAVAAGHGSDGLARFATVLHTEASGAAEAG
jgi:hypothetical protein